MTIRLHNTHHNRYYLSLGRCCLLFPIRLIILSPGTSFTIAKASKSGRMLLVVDNLLSSRFTVLLIIRIATSILSVEVSHVDGVHAIVEIVSETRVSSRPVASTTITSRLEEKPLYRRLTSKKLHVLKLQLLKLLQEFDYVVCVPALPCVLL